MIKKILLSLTILFSLSGVFFVPVSSTYAQSTAIQSDQYKFDLGSVTQKDIKEQNWIRKGIDYVFERIVTILAATIGAAAVMMMAAGGIRMIASAGRQEEYDNGKKMMTRAALGVVFVLGAYLMVTTVQLLIKSIFNA